MTANSDKKFTPSTVADIKAHTIGGARPHGGPIVLVEYDANWTIFFGREAARIRQVLGERAVRIEHVGSTAVPGLAAKPVIDIVMEVADSSDESSYVPALELNGYQLRIREPGWWEHRMLKGPDTDINLHVFSVGCPEVSRMLRFRDQLRANPADREFYQSEKRELAARAWAYVQNYADAKTDVIEQIIAKVG